MRDLILTLIIPAGLLWAMTSARGAVLVLTWVAFQRPYDFSYGTWLGVPVWQIAFIITVASVVLRGEFKLKFPFAIGVYLVLVCWITLTCFTAFSPSQAWSFFQQFVIPTACGLVVTVAAINDLQLLKAVIWVAAGSLGINALKTGLSLTLSGGGHLTDQIFGFVGDNNIFGLVLCLVVATLMGLRHTLPPDRKWLRLAFFGALAFIILTIIYTQSRGAFLTLGVILVVASLLGGKPVRHLMLLVCVGILGYLVVPSDNFARLQTLGNVSEDSSAMGRIESWHRAIAAANEHPLLGIGLGNHLPYHMHRDPGGHVLVAHSTYFQVLGELSYGGLLLYLLFIFAAVGMFWRTWKMASSVVVQFPELVWVRDLAFWMLCGYVGYLFGSALLNMLLIEFPWYFVMLGALIRPMLKQEVDRRNGVVAPAPGKGKGWR